MENNHEKITDQRLIPQLNDSLASDQRVEPQNMNDDEETKMILDQQLTHQLTKKLKEKNVPVSSLLNSKAALPQQITLKSETKIKFFNETSMKSLIIFLLLLSLLMVTFYMVLQQVYEIQHPQKVMGKQRTDNRINTMIQQDNKKAKHQKQHKNEEEKQQSIQKKKPIEKTEKDQNIQKVSLAKKEKEKQQNTQKENQNIESKQLQKQKKDSQQQIVVNEIEQIKSKQNNKESLQSNLKEKGQLVENFQKSQSKKPTQIPNLKKDISFEEKKSDQKNKNNHESFNPDVQQFAKPQQSITKLPNIVKPPNIPQSTIIQKPNTPQQSPSIPEKKLTNQQQQRFRRQNRFSAFKPLQKQNTGPVAKAGISAQQALKWTEFQKILQLPLQTQLSTNPMLLEQYTQFEKRYNISKFSQLPICVVIPTYNNVKNDRYKDNMKSILQQNYTNYHVVVIDDKSDDHTGDYIQKYINEMDLKYQQKVKVIINQERKMAMPNLRYAAMNECRENELFIIVDGDDLLIGRQVFKLFSAVMQQRDLWVMWTNFLSPKGSIGYSRQYNPYYRKSNNYRKAGFVMSHLRAYYTKLFRLIKEQDLQDQNGQYFHAANDVAIGIPILEMAHQHTAYVPEISYFYNLNTGLNNHQVRLKEQKSNDKKIRQKQKYQALKSLDFDEQPNNGESPKIKEKIQQKTEEIKANSIQETKIQQNSLKPDKQLIYNSPPKDQQLSQQNAQPTTQNNK